MRVSLDPGQTKTVALPLAASQLAYWDVQTHAFHVETEPVRLEIGDSSARLPLHTTLQVQ